MFSYFGYFSISMGEFEIFTQEHLTKGDFYVSFKNSYPCFGNNGVLVAVLLNLC